jgi:hypothetical protein
MMNADGAVDDGELQFLLQFSTEARKKLSKPYDIGSKEGKFVAPAGIPSRSLRSARCSSLALTGN